MAFRIMESMGSDGPYGIFKRAPYVRIASRGLKEMRAGFALLSCMAKLDRAIVRL